MSKVFHRFVLLIMLLGIMLPVSSLASPNPSTTINFTIISTNDFHGQLEYPGTGSTTPGFARTVTVIKDIQTAVGGAQNTLWVDAGDEMQGSLLSNLQKGKPTIDLFNYAGLAAATFGNHEFDWGQQTLISRTMEADYPFVSANIVVNDTGNCATAGWTSPSFTTPWITRTVGTAPNQAIVGIIGVTTQETPFITMASSTAGLCFKDPTDSIVHYYDTLKANSDFIVALTHIGYTDGGYGYGFSVYGDQTLATNLINAGKPVPLIVGGHSHTNLSPATVVTVSGKPGKTWVTQARYNGRTVGRADVTLDKTAGTVDILWTKNAVNPPPVALTDPPATPEDAGTLARILTWSSDPDYQALINTKIGYTHLSLTRNYWGDSLLADFIDDAVYNSYNQDAVPENDMDIFFQNAGGLRADIPASTDPYTLTYGTMYNVLPFGNQTVVGDMNGVQILDLLNQSASLLKGALQPAGLRYKFFFYGTKPASGDGIGKQWGAYDVEVYNRNSASWEPLDMAKTYKVGTNEFLAPAGGDFYNDFKYMTNIWYSREDMLDAVDRWVSTTYTIGNPYQGPDLLNPGVVDNRILQVGGDTFTGAPGQIIPITVLHHNDSHGNLQKGTPASKYVGYTQLVTLIKQERANNPLRNILLSGGDNIQGDSMEYYFKTAPQGFAADGTPLPAELQMNPLIKAFNSMNYTAMVLGNHEFNFGSEVFTSTLEQANFPILGANVTDTGAYGLSQVGVEPSLSVSVGPEHIKIGILGITNHRVPNYELPSNIPGLTFSNPIQTAITDVPALRAANDAVIALTHIGFTTNPKSVEVDNNVDTVLAAQVPGIDAIIGSHSHTIPAPTKPSDYDALGTFKFLPAMVVGPGDQPVIINQAQAYNYFLGEIFLGMLPKAGGGYYVVSRAGRDLAVDYAKTVEDAATKALIDPYSALLTTYNNTQLGQTKAPIDALSAFTQETTGANLQADAVVYELGLHGITPDIHISGAMTNKRVAATATITTPITVTVADMFTVMPYENSIVVMDMTGPQIKAVLERGYRNYYYYKYVPGYGGYSHYTTCMLDTNSIGKIIYRDTYPALPNGDNVSALLINGVPVDFNDATKTYSVSTVNYLAAGSCNFNDSGVSLWPIPKITHDTQLYVRDAVIDYIKHEKVVFPQVEGRLEFLNQFQWLPTLFK